MGNRKLLLDEMLGRTARWLRVFGIDTAWARPANDNELIGIAEREGRVLVTKDGELALRCEKKNIQILLLKGDDFIGQLAEIRDRLGIEFLFPHSSRCAGCNTPLKPAGKEDVKGKVPDDILAAENKFWACPGCGKVYWEGGHWRNITRIYEEVRAKRE